MLTAIRYRWLADKKIRANIVRPFFVTIDKNGATVHRPENFICLSENNSYLVYVSQLVSRNVVVSQLFAVESYALYTALHVCGIVDADAELFAAEVLGYLEAVPFSRDRRCDSQTVKVRTHTADTLYTSDHNCGCCTCEPVNMRTSLVG